MKIVLFMLFMVIFAITGTVSSADAKPDVQPSFTLNSTSYQTGDTIKITAYGTTDPFEIDMNIEVTDFNSILVYNNTEWWSNGMTHTFLADWDKSGTYSVKLWHLYQGIIYDAIVSFNFTVLYCGETIDFYNVINGTNNSDYIFGTQSPDLIFGNGGNDLIKSQGNYNCIFGGDGDDWILASKEYNVAYGGSGNDFIKIRGFGEAYGGEGNDMILIGNPQVNGYVVDGGVGIDTCVTDYPWRSAVVNNCEIVTSDVIQ